LAFIASKHGAISFGLYCAAFLGFVLSLEIGWYKIQFKQLAWTIVTLILVVVQTSFHIANMFEGLIWFFLPCSLVICNDIMAFVFGSLFGRTPLIALSPKKTWEGFIGGTIATLVFGYFWALLLSQSDMLICPKEELLSWGVNCTPSDLFQYTAYQVPIWVQSIFTSIGISFSVFHAYPIQMHALVFAIFTSIISPFGGFFASGLKRGLKIKDFGDSIPGHGGVTDRMDCQIVTGVFAYVYYTSFIKRWTLGGIMATIYVLSPSDQLRLFHQLKDMLIAQGLMV